jgi:hypothetical protein
MNYLEVSWIIFNVVTGIVLWFVALFLLACGLMAILERVGTAIFVTGMVMLTYASSLGVS